MSRLTNKEHEIIGRYCVELMQSEYQHNNHAINEIAKKIVDSQNEPGILVLKRYPTPAERQGKSVPHFLKCCIDAGVVDSEDLPEITRWKRLKKEPCYKLTPCWYKNAYGSNSKVEINHGDLSDYRGRTCPEYLTEQALEMYLSAETKLPRYTVKTDKRKDFIATMIFVSSFKSSTHKNYPIDESVRSVEKYGFQAFLEYEKVPTKKQRQVFCESLVESSVNELSVSAAINKAKNAAKIDRAV